MSEQLYINLLAIQGKVLLKKTSFMLAIVLITAYLWYGAAVS